MVGFGSGVPLELRKDSGRNAPIDEALEMMMGQK
jgi:hypothetical protein